MLCTVVGTNDCNLVCPSIIEQVRLTISQGIMGIELCYNLDLDCFPMTHLKAWSPDCDTIEKWQKF
jgi:hypothetical protein